MRIKGIYVYCLKQQLSHNMHHVSVSFHYYCLLNFSFGQSSILLDHKNWKSPDSQSGHKSLAVLWEIINIYLSKWSLGHFSLKSWGWIWGNRLGQRSMILANRSGHTSHTEYPLGFCLFSIHPLCFWYEHQNFLSLRALLVRLPPRCPASPWQIGGHWTQLCPLGSLLWGELTGEDSPEETSH